MMMVMPGPHHCCTLCFLTFPFHPHWINDKVPRFRKLSCRDIALLVFVEQIET
jgi:hypothetical protein